MIIWNVSKGVFFVKEEQIVVLKCGGSSIDDLSDTFFYNLKSLMTAGIKPVIVHGGGPAIQRLLDQLNIESEFVDGLRKTTEEMMDVVEMVLVGKVNPAFTRRVNAMGISAVGISGSDMNLLQADAINFDRYGFVGEVSEVNTDYIHQLLEAGIVPVISPIAIGKDQKRYNINADTAAGAVASALHAKQLIFVTDVPGILKDDKLLESVTTEEVDQFIADGTIYGGMIPKVKAAVSGLMGNVDEVMIVNGKKSELMNKTTFAGTTIMKAHLVKA